MNIFSLLYTEILWRPLFNGLVFFYSLFGLYDAGIAIVVLTVFLRILLLPLHLKAQRSQYDLARIQPEIKHAQEQFKNDREAQGKALMDIYAKNKINPFSGCLVMLLQLPILIAMFSVFRHGFQPEQLSFLYSFVPHPESLNPIGFGFLDLSVGNIWLGIAAAITQYFQTRLSLPPPVPSATKNDFASMMQKQTLYLLPVLILFWSRTFPAALIVYWTTQNIFGIVQEIVVKKVKAKQGV